MSVRVGWKMLDIVHCRQDKPWAVSLLEVLVIEEQHQALCHLWGIEDRGEGAWKVRDMLKPYVACDAVWLRPGPICLAAVHLSLSVSVLLINAPLFSAQHKNITTRV